MLIEKGLVAGEIVTLKLFSGEELVAKFVEDKDNVYVISSPMVISASPQGIGLVPFLFTVDVTKEIPVDKGSVCVATNTEAGFADQYIQATTGISVSPNQGTL